MTVEQAARALGCSRQHIYRLEKRGELRIERPAIYLKGGPVRVPKADVERLRAKLSAPEG